MENMKSIFHQQNGYARMKDLKRAGIHTRNIAAAQRDGIIERISPGLFRLIEFPWDEYAGFTDIAAASKNAVICLTSAADYYGITTFNPTEVSVALPHNGSKFGLAFPPLKLYFFPAKYYEFEIRHVKTVSGSFKIYSVEKTLIDLFRYRKKIGDDIVLEALKLYLTRNKNKSADLLACARHFGLLERMLPYIKGMII